MDPERERLLDDLHTTIFEFITDLADIFTDKTERGDLTLIEFFYKRQHRETVMQHTVKQLLPHKKRIANRDIRFFDNNRYIFAGLPEDRVQHYSDRIVNQNFLGKDNLDIIWQYLDTMIACAELYKKDA